MPLSDNPSARKPNKNIVCETLLLSRTAHPTNDVIHFETSPERIVGDSDTA